MITLTINGRNWMGELADPTMPLQWMLRDIVGLGGAASCCGGGCCADCLVLADGALARSCAAGVGSFAGCEVVTLEGLSDMPLAGRGEVAADALQKMCAAAGLPACESCRPAVLLGLFSLLRSGARPGIAEVEGVLSNICSCTSRSRLRVAVRALCADAAEELH